MYRYGYRSSVLFVYGTIGPALDIEALWCMDGEQWVFLRTSRVLLTVVGGLGSGEEEAEASSRRKTAASGRPMDFILPLRYSKNKTVSGRTMRESSCQCISCDNTSRERYVPKQCSDACRIRMRTAQLSSPRHFSFSPT